MDGCLTDWHTDDIDVDFPVPLQRSHLGLDNELMELVWRNGEAVLHSQNTRKTRYDHPIYGSKHDEPVSWIDCCPIDESFHFSENPFSDLSGKSESPEKVYDFSTSHVFPTPPPRFQSVEAANHNQHIESRINTCDMKQCSVTEPSVITMEPSHHSTNQVLNEVNMSWASSCGIARRSLDENYGRKVSSGKPESSCRNRNSQSNDSNRNKRKSIDVEEVESPSEDAPEFESGRGDIRQSQKCARKNRVAEVHNLSERKRRDRINEKMRALQELIPHAHKSDKASMLDEAIEYMKSLQLQLQWLWMGSGMSQMMHYLYHSGMGMRPATLPAIQNLMYPLVGQAMAAASLPNQPPMGDGVNLTPFRYPNMMQNRSFPAQYPGNM